MPIEEKKLLHRYHGKNYMEVVDQGDYRSLYFRGGVVQSRIFLADPTRLILRYTRYMMAASLLAGPEPQKILLIGIGAGALIHFLRHHLPHCSIEAVDYSESIIRIARDYFALQEDDHLSVHCSDGLRYLQGPGRGQEFDLILVDAFNDSGMARNIYSSEFFRLAGDCLDDEGVLCCNLWSGNREVFEQVKGAILKYTQGALFIPVRRRENVIGLLFPGEVPWKAICPPSAILGRLSERFDLDFAEVSAAAQKNNMRLGERLQFWFC